MEKIMFNNLSIEHDGDIIFCTVAKYKLFMSYGQIGMDAYLLYSHLMFTCRLQETNSVWANNKYIREGLKWGKVRLQKAKNLLFDLNLIEQKQSRKENGDFDKFYIMVKTTTSVLEFSGGTETGDPSIHPPILGNKCFNKERKCLNKKENICGFVEKILLHWNSKEKLQQHKIKTVLNNLKKKTIAEIQEYELEDILKAIDNYYTIATGKEYWYTWVSFSLWDFLSRGLHKFMNDACYESFRKKSASKDNRTFRQKNESAYYDSLTADGQEQYRNMFTNFDILQSGIKELE